LESRINELEQSIKLHENSLTETEAKRQEAQYQSDILKFWEYGFGLRGIRSMLLDGVAEQLTEKANGYLKAMSGGGLWLEVLTQSHTKDGELRDKLEVRVFNNHGAGCYGGNSSGERQRIDIALALALHAMGLERAQQKFGFIIMYELFAHLDETGCENVIDLLRKERTNLGTVFVVSHNPLLSQRFDAGIMVEKRNGISTLVKPVEVQSCVKSEPSSITRPAEKSSTPRRRRAPAIS
jgi:DNA repair exonuclease SbcCD ATPase subunit